jgi:predicted O-methyltransferase YrrM
MAQVTTSMNNVLQQILETHTVSDGHGTSIKLDSPIDPGRGEFLQKLIRQVKPKTSLEVGLAYGISTLFICETLKEIGSAKHIVIDPWQTHWWNSIGLYHLEISGFLDIVEFHLKRSEIVLPTFFGEGLKIDFAFIDGKHNFDHVLVDFFYVDKMLPVGGVVAFDDSQFASINRVCRFIQRNLKYEVIATYTAAGLAHNLKSNLRRFLPSTSGIPMVAGPTCMALRKIGDDDRNSGHYVDF